MYSYCTDKKAVSGIVLLSWAPETYFLLDISFRRTRCNKSQRRVKQKCVSWEVSRVSVSAMYLGFMPTLSLTFFQSIPGVRVESRYIGYFHLRTHSNLYQWLYWTASLTKSLPRTANLATNALAAATAISAVSWRAGLLGNTAADPGTVYPCARTTFMAAASKLLLMRMIFSCVLLRRVRRRGRVLRRRGSLLSSLWCGFETSLCADIKTGNFGQAWVDFVLIFDAADAFVQEADLRIVPQCGLGLEPCAFCLAFS